MTTDKTTQEDADRFMRQDVAEFNGDNARLRDAAPDMLEALKWYAEKLSHVRKNHSEGNAARTALSDDCGKRAEIAIAKAEAQS